MVIIELNCQIHTQKYSMQYFRVQQNKYRFKLNQTILQRTVQNTNVSESARDVLNYSTHHLSAWLVVGALEATQLYWHLV